MEEWPVWDLFLRPMFGPLPDLASTRNDQIQKDILGGTHLPTSFRHNSMVHYGTNLPHPTMVRTQNGLSDLQIWGIDLRIWGTIIIESHMVAMGPLSLA